MDVKTVNVRAKPHNYRGEPFTDEDLVSSVIKSHPGMDAKWYVNFLVCQYGMPKNDAKTLVKYIGGL